MTKSGVTLAKVSDDGAVAVTAQPSIRFGAITMGKGSNACAGNVGVNIRTNNNIGNDTASAVTSVAKLGGAG